MEEELEVVVKLKAPDVGRKTVLRWVGEISVDREEEMTRLFALKPGSDRERAVLESVATWFSGVDLAVQEVELVDAEEALPAANDETTDQLRASLAQSLAGMEEAALQSLSEFVAKYNIIRATSPTLLALGPKAVVFLVQAGFKSDGQYLKVDDRVKLGVAREVLEQLRNSGGGEEGSTISREFLRASHGSNVGKSHLSYGFFDSIGRRKEMEDEATASGSVFAVFDGHGGCNAAKLCAFALRDVLDKELAAVGNDWSVGVTACFAELHRQVTALRFESGSTAVVAQVLPEMLRIAHAGDSRAVLVVAKGKGKRLTEDHKPANAEERNRIEACGGRVVKTFLSNVYRVNGELSVSRAIGDVRYSEFGVTHVPTCSEVARTEDMALLILACDGVWDVLDDNAAAKAVWECVEKKKKTVQEAAQSLVELAFKKGSMDNLSCVVVDLRAGQLSGERESPDAINDYL